MENKLANIETNNTLNNLVSQLEDITKFAEVVKSSKAFGSSLSTTEDIIAAVVLGQELGINPMVSITMGKRLTAEKIFSVLKGKAMGIDAITSMEHIHDINGHATTDVHIISGQLLKAGVVFKVLEDYTPLYKYRDSNGQGYDKELVETNKEIYQILTPSSTDVEKNNKKQKVYLDSKPYTYRTSIEFKRTVKFGNTTEVVTIPISYTLEQATEAGLYKGVDSTNKVVKGKDNWNNHPATMLRNRCISIGGRIIASDFLNGIYEFSEITDEGNIAYTTEIEGEQTILKDNKGNIINTAQDISTQEVTDSDISEIVDSE